MADVGFAHEPELASHAFLNGFGVSTDQFKRAATFVSQSYLGRSSI